MTRMRRLGVLLCAVLMFTAATGSALAEDGHGDEHHGDHHHKGPPPANVAQAKLCLHHGWKTYVRADLTPFRNVAACVVYALKGGVLTTPPPPKSQAQLDCESNGGTFAGPSIAFLWRCGFLPFATEATWLGPLRDQCVSVKGTFFTDFGGETTTEAAVCS
jgi:hypothetical protein